MVPWVSGGRGADEQVKAWLSCCSSAVDGKLFAQLELDVLSNGEYVNSLYRLALRRPPDEAARSRAVSSLVGGTLSRAMLLAELVGAAEFARVCAPDDAIAFAAWARAAGERPRELRTPVGDERSSEIPWRLGRLRRENCLSDVGTAFAEPAYVSALVALGSPGLVGHAEGDGRGRCAPGRLRPPSSVRRPALGEARLRRDADGQYNARRLAGRPHDGPQIVRLASLDAFGSQSASTAVTSARRIWGAPVSTTLVVASSVVGVGGGRRRSRNVRWSLVGAMAGLGARCRSPRDINVREVASPVRIREGVPARRRL